MPSITGQNLINRALETLGIIDPQASPSVSDSTTGLNELNQMWSAWGIDEGLIYAQRSFTGAIVSGTGSYTIGTGATFSTQLPQKIYKAFFTTDSNGNRNEVEIVNADKYYSHNDLTAAAKTPEIMFPDWTLDASGYATIYLWPVPTGFAGSANLNLDMAVAFTTWALATAYNLPDGYIDTIAYALAFRLIPKFGDAVTEYHANFVAQIGQKSEARLRAMNSYNRQVDPMLAAAPGSVPAGAKG